MSRLHFEERMRRYGQIKHAWKGSKEPPCYYCQADYADEGLIELEEILPGKHWHYNGYTEFALCDRHEERQA